MATLVYIGGFGRSGSTLLEYLLACDQRVLACGEVARHVRRSHTRRLCTCGRPAPECPVWGRFQASSTKVRGDLTHEELTLKIRRDVAAKYSAMVDSSKTAWGSSLVPFRLHRALGFDFLLVHIVRDPRAVCWSTIRTPGKIKKGRKPASPFRRCLQTAIGWVAANLACEIFGLRHPERYLRVRYEDLVHMPHQTMEEIFGKVGLQSNPALELTGSGDNRHQLYGNAMRFRSMSPFSLEEDTAWKSAMPKMYRALAAISWPLAARYGYFRSRA